MNQVNNEQYQFVYPYSITHNFHLPKEMYFRFKSQKPEEIYESNGTSALYSVLQLWKIPFNSKLDS